MCVSFSRFDAKLPDSYAFVPDAGLLAFRCGLGDRVRWFVLIDDEPMTRRTRGRLCCLEKSGRNKVVNVRMFVEFPR